jgi:signal transduction histidine kinase
MGLSFARRVALAHGGELILASRPGKGTAVEIGLPAG